MTTPNNAKASFIYWECEFTLPWTRPKN